MINRVFRLLCVVTFFLVSNSAIAATSNVFTMTVNKPISKIYPKMIRSLSIDLDS